MENKINIMLFIVLSISFTLASVNLVGDLSYNSTNINITQENSFAHLNISDGDVNGYWSFDVQEATDVWRVANNSNGLDLDGVKNWVNLTNMGTPSGATISYWIYKSNWNSGGTYIMDGRNPGGTGWWYLNDYTDGDADCVDTSGNICFNDLVEIRSGNFSSNTWYNVILTFNSSQTKIYLNKVLMDTGSGVTPSLANMRIGTRYTNTGYINATYDEVRIYNRIINQTEVDELFEHTINNRTGLICELLLDETSGIVANDTSGNNNSGNLFNYGLNFGRYYTYDSSNFSNDGIIYNVTWNLSGHNGGSYRFEENMSSHADLSLGGITVNDTFIWTSDYFDLKSYKYWMNGTYTRDRFDLNANGYTRAGYNRGTYGIVQNNTFFWVTSYLYAEVLVYYMNGTYTGTHWDTAGSGCANPRGLTMNDTFIWIVDDADDEVYQYWINGTYTGTHWDTGIALGGNNNPWGITNNNTFFWITDDSDDVVYRYLQNGTYNSNFSISGSGATDSKGIANNNTFLFINDMVDARVYRYWINGTYYNYFSTAIDGRPSKYIRTVLPFNNASNFTYGCWINPKNSTSSNTKANLGRLYGNYDGWIWWNDGSGGYVGMNIGNATGDNGLNTGSKSFPEEVWGQFIITKEGENFSMYSNGVLKQTRLITGRLRQDLTTFNSIGSYATGYSYINYLQYNGSIDECIAINSSSNASEVKKIYDNQYPLFYPTGEMNFTNLNFRENSTVNISITNCKQLNGTTINFSINGESYLSLNSTCSYNNYNIVGNLTNTFLTLQLISNTYNSYSPVISGNILLDSFNDTTAPSIDFISPTEQNCSYISKDYIYINTSSSDAEEYSVFTDFNKSLLGYWSMDYYNATGFYDNSSYNIFLTDNGGLNYSNLTKGMRGNGLSFDGVDDYLRNSDFLDGEFYPNGFTVEFWIYENPQHNKIPIEKGSNCASASNNYGWQFKIYNSNILFSTCRGSQYAYNTADGGDLQNYTWTHITGVHDTINGNMQIYLDGVLKHNYTLASPSQLNSTKIFNIGRSGAGANFNGSLDEVKVIGRVLSLNEIQSDYNATRYEHNFTGLPDGNYTAESYAIDYYGNFNLTGLITLTIDTTNPNISNLYPSNNTYRNNQTTNFSANVTDNIRLKNVSLSIFNSLGSLVFYNSTTLTTTEIIIEYINILVDGVYNWFVRTFDLVNNSYTTTNQTLTIDTTPPTIQIIYPINGTNSSDFGLNINYTYYDLNVDTCWWTDDAGGINTTMSCGTNLTGTWITGINHVTIFINDSAGNENQSEIYFTIDNLPPAINITYPLNTTYNSQVTKLNYTITEVHPSYCWFYNGTVNTTLTTPGTNFTTVSKEGYNNWTIFCNDSVNNLNSSVIYFIQDTTSPSISITNPSYDGENVNTRILVIQWNTSEQTNCSYSFDGNINTSILASDNISYSLTVSYPELSNGNHNIRVFCDDLYWNKNISGNYRTFYYQSSTASPSNPSNKSKITPNINQTTNQTINQTELIEQKDATNEETKENIKKLKIIICSFLFILVVLLAFFLDLARRRHRKK